MNKLNVAGMVLILTACFAGCGTIQRNLNLADPEVSCIKTDHQSFLQYLYERSDTPHVMIGTVDGVPTAGGAIYCLSPGTHKLRVIGYTKAYERITDVDVEIKPKTKYWLRASPSDRFAFQLLDVTGTSEVMLIEFK